MEAPPGEGARTVASSASQAAELRPAAGWDGGRGIGRGRHCRCERLDGRRRRRRFGLLRRFDRIRRRLNRTGRREAEPLGVALAGPGSTFTRASTMGVPSARFRPGQISATTVSPPESTAWCQPGCIGSPSAGATSCQPQSVAVRCNQEVREPPSSPFAARTIVSAFGSRSGAGSRVAASSSGRGAARHRQLRGGIELDLLREPFERRLPLRHLRGGFPQLLCRPVGGTPSCSASAASAAARSQRSASVFTRAAAADARERRSARRPST